MHRQWLEHDGKAILVTTLWDDDGHWVHLLGKTFFIETLKKNSRKVAKNENPQDGLSPMPGKILSVAKSVNENVMAGETVLTLEAMKMEFPIKSSGKGVIKAIPFAPGASVKKGDLLFSIDYQIDRQRKEES